MLWMKSSRHTRLEEFKNHDYTIRLSVITSNSLRFFVKSRKNNIVSSADRTSIKIQSIYDCVDLLSRLLDPICFMSRRHEE